MTFCRKVLSKLSSWKRIRMRFLTLIFGSKKQLFKSKVEVWNLNLWFESSKKHDLSHDLLWFESSTTHDSNKIRKRLILAIMENYDSSQVNLVIRNKSNISNIQFSQLACIRVYNVHDLSQIIYHLNLNVITCDSSNTWWKKNNLLG